MIMQHASTDSVIRLLYVEDDAGLARLLQKQLERKFGFDVDLASDGEAGLYSLKHHDYDVALVDYNLPVLNGVQLLRILKDNGINTPVIILTGAGTEEIAVDVMRAGAVDYLVKQADELYLERIGEVVKRVWSERQIQLRREMVQAEQRLAKKVFDVTKEGIVVTDAKSVIQAVNPAFSAITGFSADEVIGKRPSVLRSKRNAQDFYRQMWQAIDETDSWEGEIWNRRKNGDEYLEWLNISAVRDDSGAISEYVGVFSDISQRKADEEKIWHQANYDLLTDLPNRSLLIDRAQEAMRRARRENISMGLIFVDLDHFKFINDHYGHNVGDQVLVEVSRRITSVLRESDTVIRLCGDEFVVLLPHLHHAADADAVAEKVIDILSNVFVIHENKTYLSASAGIALFPDDGESIETLLANADIAMYQAKEAGRNQHLFFNQQMNRLVEHRAEIERDLQQAMKSNQLMMYFQPVVDLVSLKSSHAEALIRWQHPVKGMVMPDEFIPIAEQSGLIISLGEWVVNAVADQVMQWHQSGLHGLHVFLNVSPVQMLHANLGRQMQEVMGRINMTDGSIGIEVTENVMIEGPEKVKKELLRIRANGARFLLDDFGTGFSSMRYLREMPFDGLKIDRDFVSGCDLDPEKAVLVKTMIEMAHSLKLNVVAEGIETEGELDLLREFGCDYGQGYLIGRPMPAEQFADWMYQNRISA